MVEITSDDFLTIAESFVINKSNGYGRAKLHQIINYTYNKNKNRAKEENRALHFDIYLTFRYDENIWSFINIVIWPDGNLNLFIKSQCECGSIYQHCHPEA